MAGKYQKYSPEFREEAAKMVVDDSRPIRRDWSGKCSCKEADDPSRRGNRSEGPIDRRARSDRPARINVVAGVGLGEVRVAFLAGGVQTPSRVASFRHRPLPAYRY